MAETGKLGIADSQLGNVLLAFAGADDPLPSSGTMRGTLGTSASILGNVTPGLGGPDEPKVYCLSAVSALAFAQSVSSGAALIGHVPPAFVLGSPDSQSGDARLAFTGSDAPSPALGTKSGKLGLGLGNIVLGLEGTVGGKIVQLSAQSTLALAQSANSGAVLVGHESPHWVLGGQDSRLGTVELAFAGQSDPRPMTGTRTGKLGTSYSSLANMRLALGEEEGDTTAKTVNVTATSALSLAQSASTTAVRTRNASNTLSLDHQSTLTRVTLVSADSVLEITDESTVEVAAWGYGVSAGNALELTSEATVTVGQWSYAVTAASALSLSQSANASTHEVYDLEAANALSLDQAATGELGAVFTVSADSTLSLTDSADAEVRQWLHNEVAESPLSLTDSADTTVRQWLHEGIAENTLALTQAASTQNVFARAATSAISLVSQSWGTTAAIRDLEAASVLELDQALTTVNTLGLTAASTLELYDDLELVARPWHVSADSPLSLTQGLVVARPWYLSAATVMAETHLEFVPGTLDIIDVTTGLSSSADVLKTLNLHPSSPLTLRHSVMQGMDSPGGILVSASNTLELSQNAWTTQLGDAYSVIVLSQEATAFRGKGTGSELDLGQSAGVTVVRNRSVESDLSLGQSVTYVLVRHGAVDLVNYKPAGSGPIPPTLQGPFPGVTSPFALIYPATGAAEDTVELRPPNLGNKDRLSFDRINRESRGGTLKVFADPDWPKVQTLVLSFSALNRDQAYELLRFMRDHLGLEVKVSDWEQRVWKGVITKPSDPVIQDSKNSYSASFEFEGELLTA